MKYCFLNGKIIPIKKAGLSLMDIGVLRGYGIFEFLRTYNSELFLFREHMARLKNSARILGIKVPFSSKEIKGASDELIKRNGEKEANVKIVLTGGLALNGIDFDPGKPTFYILTEKAEPIPAPLYLQGVKLISFEYQRKVPEAKTTDYITAVRLRSLLREEKGFEILYVSKGLVLEGTTSNFFIVKGNKVITPAKNILFGTTRNFVIKIAERFFEIEERDVRMSELKTADEAFITATNKEILPVVRIDNMKIGNGRVGEKTRNLISLFKEKTI